MRDEWLAVTVVVAVAFGYELARTLLPEAARLPANLALGALLVGWARRRGIGWAELGMTARRPDVTRGVAWGLATAVVVGLGILVALAVPAGRDALRLADAESVWSLLYKLAVNIPLQTALFEEVVFRGVVLALLVAATGAVRAVLVSAVLFGVWHIVPTIENATGGASVGEVAGAVALTFAAGWLFAGLRLVSGSVLAPTVAHVATNGLPYLAGWLLAA